MLTLIKGFLDIINAQLYRKQLCQFWQDNDPNLAIMQCLKYRYNKQL